MSKADRLVTAVIIGKVAAHGEMQTAARRMAAGILRPFGYLAPTERRPWA
jgi:hypothetical protein